MTESKEKRRLNTSEIKKLPKDSTFYVLGVVSRFAQRKDKNDNPFWDIAIMDGEGQIDGKIWGSSEWWNRSDDITYKMDPLTDEKIRNLEGRTIGAQGKIVAFREQNQCNFNAVYYVDQDKYPPHEFVRRSSVAPEKMEQDFHALIDACGEPIKGFLKYIFFEKNIWQTYSVWPAAVSLHHAYVGGLLEHSIAVARSAAGMARSYLSREGQDLGLELDIVIAGALLHDIGKLEAYRLSPTPEMTLEGSIMEHIILGCHRLMSLAEEYAKHGGSLDNRRVLALEHILVSHHGSKEFGSPVLPATPEALIVSMADDLDFKLFCWKEQVSLLDGGKDGGKEITEFIAPVQRRFWKVHAPENGAELAELAKLAK